jgi:hypothetical protein
MANIPASCGWLTGVAAVQALSNVNILPSAKSGWQPMAFIWRHLAMAAGAAARLALAAYRRNMGGAA